MARLIKILNIISYLTRCQPSAVELELLLQPSRDVISHGRKESKEPKRYTLCVIKADCRAEGYGREITAGRSECVAVVFSRLQKAANR